MLPPPRPPLRPSPRSSRPSDETQVRTVASFRQYHHHQQRERDQLRNSNTSSIRTQDTRTDEIIHTQQDWSSMNMLTSAFEFRGNGTGFFTRQNPYPSQTRMQQTTPVNYSNMNPMPWEGNIFNAGCSINQGQFSNSYYQPQYYAQNQDQPQYPVQPNMGSVAYSSNAYISQPSNLQQISYAQAPGYANFTVPYQSLPSYDADPNQNRRCLYISNSQHGNNTATHNFNTWQPNLSSQSSSNPLHHGNIYAMPQNPNRQTPAVTSYTSNLPGSRRDAKSSSPHKKTRRPRVKLTSDPFEKRQGQPKTEQNSHRGGEQRGQQTGDRFSQVGGRNEIKPVRDIMPTDEEIEAMNAMTDEEIRFAAEELAKYDWN